MQPSARSGRGPGNASGTAGTKSSDKPPPREPTPPQARSDDNGEGWLFKNGDVLLGPVTARVLIERIEAGELVADTPIAREAGQWQPLASVSQFKIALESFLEEKRRAEVETRYAADVRRTRALRAALVLVILVLPLAGGAVVGRQLMVMRPWDRTLEWRKQTPRLIDLPAKIAKVAPPPVPVAPPPAPPVDDDKGEGKGGDDTVAKNDRDDKSDKNDKKGDKKSDKKGNKKDDKKLAAADKKGNDKNGGKDEKDDKKVEEKATPEKPEERVAELTNAQATAPLKTVYPDLKKCFSTEMKDNPDVPAEARLQYTITEEGRATNIGFDNRELRGRPVVDCVQKAISTLRWPKFSGERKNVIVPLKLGRPPPPK